MSCQLQIYSMMAKRKYDDVQEEDSISDDLLNQHYDELEKQQYGGEISDDQLNELYDQLDQQQSDAAIQTWVWNNQVVLSLTLNFKMLDSGKIGKRQRINKDMRPPSSRHELYLMAIRSEKKLQMRQRGKILKNVLKKSFRGQTLIEIYFGLFFRSIRKQIQQKKGSSHGAFHFTSQSDELPTPNNQPHSKQKKS